MVVHNYKDYSVGMRRKLVLEISQNVTPIKQAQIIFLPERPYVPVAAASQLQGDRGSQILPSAPNEFSKQCDNFSGPFSFGNF